LKNRQMIEGRSDSTCLELVEDILIATPILQALEVAVKVVTHCSMPLLHHNSPAAPRDSNRAGEACGIRTYKRDRRFRPLPCRPAIVERAHRHFPHVSRT
jgi:hypothetical protein